jgi:hypothetical protein
MVVAAEWIISSSSGSSYRYNTNASSCLRDRQRGKNWDRPTDRLIERPPTPPRLQRQDADDVYPTQVINFKFMKLLSAYVCLSPAQSSLRMHPNTK